MTQTQHRLSDINLIGMVATCKVCGPNAQIRIRKRKRVNAAGESVTDKIPTCKTKQIESVKAAPSYQTRKGAHGLTMQQARDYLNGKVCEVCGTADNLRVDHCHRTGKIRGPLCNDHNLAAGMCQDDPVTLRRLADYLESHQDVTRTDDATDLERD